uniref:Small ribosomal subunit protein uS3 n=1 Tax=Aquifex pyrophilus TaxID=2714 RepID=RS3_AQUPY|nr:RecName: Full=Small ribosomal subunit protein uS3; AltName: Full=30S ribosomal protein S3 [Aquifex pyrophilus]AAD08791.1 ribosomal protein S3 [Aquifex pyrophilus]
MGQKTHPIGFRLGVIKDWPSKWYPPKKDYAKLLHEDLKIKNYIKKRYKVAGVSKVEIERIVDKVRIKIHTAKPAIVIGRRGQEVDRLKKTIERMLPGKEISISVLEVKVPELDAQLVAEDIALQIERRVSHRRAMKRAIDNALKAGQKGVKVQVKGRIGGAARARKEWFLVGRMPLQTLRADIDYGFATAYTKYGILSVKVWIYKGDVLKGGKEEILKKIEEEIKQAAKEG